MPINWSDPSKNSAADLDAYRKWIDDTDPAKNHSSLYQPAANQGGKPQRDNTPTAA